MNRKQVILATILIVVGLVGVASVQMLWLQSAIRDREQVFDRKAYEAMDEIAQGIEELEYHPMLGQLFSDITTGTTGINKENDSIRQLLNQEGMMPDSMILIENESGNYYRIYQSGVDSVSYVDISQQKINNLLEAQMGELQQMLMREMISLRPISEIIDTSGLNKLIKNALRNKGLKTHFNYGITEFADNNFVLISEKADLSELFRTKYSIKLFPRSLVDGNKYLKISFPDQQSFLLKTMTGQLLSSFLFFVMIIAAFGLSYRVIFKQKRLSDMKTDFINNMTHELKTPIATISLASEMLKDPVISSIESSRLKYAGVIFEENKRLANHVEQVLQIARLEKGELQLNFNDTDLHEIIQNVIKQFDLICDEYEGEITSDLKASPSILKLDEMHFSNVIKNLLDNAFKYNDKKPKIHISTQNIRDGIQILVKDNGIGLSKEDQHKVFEKFYRVQRGNVHDTKGFGLGLNYVKSIVEAHHGRVTIDSKLKEGTTFAISLPYNS